MPALTERMIMIARTVECPRCKAQPGEPCTGKPHMARNQALSAEAYDAGLDALERVLTERRPARHMHRTARKTAVPPSGAYSVRQMVTRHGEWRWVRLVTCQTEADANEEVRKRKEDPNYPYVPGKLAVFHGEVRLSVTN